jgi:hypothetical protein
MATLMMRHKSFVSRRILFWSIHSLYKHREEIRDEAEAFINLIGVANVVSVVEHSMQGAPFSVVVWYRVEEAAPAEPPRPVSSDFRTPGGGRGG